MVCHFSQGLKLTFYLVREFTRDQGYYIKSRLLKKVKALYGIELPLLEERGYLSGSGVLAACSNDLPASCKVSNVIVAEEDHDDNNKESAGSGTFVSSVGYSPLRHFEPTCPFGHGISNPTPYQVPPCSSNIRNRTRRPPLGMLRIC